MFRSSQRITITFSIRPVGLLLGALAALLILLSPSAGLSQGDVRYFPETKHTVRGRFLEYWQQNGGLAQQGFPLTEEFKEKNKLDGKEYTVQYFERAVFELHPENQKPYDVLLSQLGKFELNARYPNNSNPAAAPVSEPGSGGARPTQPPSGKVEIVKQISYRDPDGTLLVDAVAANNTGRQLGGVEFEATLVDRAGQALATESSIAFASTLIRPGELLPFEFYLTDPPASFAEIRWQITIREYDPGSPDARSIYRDLALEGVSLQAPANPTSAWRLVGQVRNSGNGVARLVEVHAAVYDDAGNLLDVERSFVQQDTLNPGQVSPFELRFRPGINPSRHDVFAEGNSDR